MKQSMPFRKVLTKIFGLSADTIDNIERIVQNKGENGVMRKHYNRIGGVAKQQLQDALANVIEKDTASEKTDAAKEEPKDEKKAEKKDVKENYTFLKYLLNEQVPGTSSEDPTVMMDVQPADLRDPVAKREAMLKQRKMKNPAMKKRAIMQKIRELQQQLRDLK